MPGSPLYFAAGSALDADARSLVEAAAHAGFDGVGLRFTDEHALDTKGVAEIRTMLASTGCVGRSRQIRRPSCMNGSRVWARRPSAAIAGTSCMQPASKSSRITKPGPPAAWN